MRSIKTRNENNMCYFCFWSEKYMDDLYFAYEQLNPLQRVYRKDFILRHIRRDCELVDNDNVTGAQVYRCRLCGHKLYVDMSLL